jgi:hypothetical protein
MERRLSSWPGLFGLGSRAIRNPEQRRIMLIGDAVANAVLVTNGRDITELKFPKCRHLAKVSYRNPVGTSQFRPRTAPASAKLIPF